MRTSIFFIQQTTPIIEFTAFSSGKLEKYQLTFLQWMISGEMDFSMLSIDINPIQLLCIQEHHIFIAAFYSLTYFINFEYLIISLEL